ATSDGPAGPAPTPPGPSRRTRRPGPRRRRDGPRAAPTWGCRPPTGTTGGRGGGRGAPPPPSHCDAAGSGRVRSTTSAIRPKVPSDPTSRRHRSKPDTFLTVGPPALTTVPSADT